MDRSKTSKELLSDKFYYFVRTAILLSVVFLFIPAFNPARICGLINKNISLFTSGISYSTLTADFGRAFKKEWVNPSTMYLLYASAVAICLGIAANAASGCLSLGNIKCKKLGNLISVIASAVELIAMVGVYVAYSQIILTEKPNKVDPMFPESFCFVVVLFALILIASVIQMVLLSKTQKE